MKKILKARCLDFFKPVAENTVQNAPERKRGVRDIQIERKNGLQQNDAKSNLSKHEGNNEIAHSEGRNDIEEKELKIGMDSNKNEDDRNIPFGYCNVNENIERANLLLLEHVVYDKPCAPLLRKKLYARTLQEYANMQGHANEKKQQKNVPNTSSSSAEQSNIEVLDMDTVAAALCLMKMKPLVVHEASNVRPTIENNNIASSSCVDQCTSASTSHTTSTAAVKKRSKKRVHKSHAHYEIQNVETNEAILLDQDKKILPKMIIKNVKRKKPIKPVIIISDEEELKSSDESNSEKKAPTLVIKNLKGTPHTCLKERNNHHQSSVRSNKEIIIVSSENEEECSEETFKKRANIYKKLEEEKNERLSDIDNKKRKIKNIHNEIEERKKKIKKTNECQKVTEIPRTNKKEETKNSDSGEDLSKKNFKKTPTKYKKTLDNKKTKNKYNKIGANNSTEDQNSFPKNSKKFNRITNNERKRKRTINEIPKNIENNTNKQTNNRGEKVNLKKKLNTPLKLKNVIKRPIAETSPFKIFTNYPEDGKIECVGLTDKRLQVYYSNEMFDEDGTHHIPAHKVTGYTFYDELKHMHPLDSNIIENDKCLFFSGYVKPVFDDNASVENGVAVLDGGPINEWWITGYDLNETAVIGFTTEYAEYYLVESSQEYAPFMRNLNEKVYICKKTLEYLTENSWRNPKYGDLLNYLTNCTRPKNMRPITEDRILSYANFVCEQVANFDVGDEKEDLFIGTDCMISLFHLSGTSFQNPSVSEPSIRRHDQIRKRKEGCLEATATDLVHRIFEKTLFIKKKDDIIRCGKCKFCQAPNCGKCSTCVDKGQTCMRRRCPYIFMRNAVASDDDTDNGINEFVSVCTARRPTINKLNELAELKDHISHNGADYYRTATVGSREMNVGDFVVMESDDNAEPPVIAKILYMYEFSDKKMFHAQLFCCATATILRETGNAREILLTNRCENCELGAIKKKVFVDYNNSINSSNFNEDIYDYFCNKRYREEVCRFEDLPDSNEEAVGYDSCILCVENLNRDNFETPVLLNGCVSWKNELYGPGTGVYLPPNTFGFKSLFPQSESVDKSAYNEIMYPEKYRKTSEYIQGSNVGTSDPFCIGIIIRLRQVPDSDIDFNVLIRKMYRPYNTDLKEEEAMRCDLHLLYWSSEVMTIPFSDILGRCYVKYARNITISTDDWFIQGPDRFYYVKGYDANTKQFYELDEPSDASNTDYIDEPKDNCYAINVPLRAMDVFAGAGGLSAGLSNSGVAKTLWAIESDAEAAKAFKVNHPGATVFQENCNDLLKLAMSGKCKTANGKPIPQPGEIELLCGGPPCQGFSGMNRFSSGISSTFRNSLIVTFLSYCDYYRPSYIIMENVRTFVVFKQGLVLKLALRCLLEMGYQCTFAILQAGHYGVPQSRRRFILLASLPGTKLPKFPEPMHVFNARVSHLDVVVDRKRYSNGLKRFLSAPYRTIVVNDVISGLPLINVGKEMMKLSDKFKKRLHHYQRIICKNKVNSTIYDHICKSVAPLVKARIQSIPCSRGADWRDIPNVSVIVEGKHYCDVLIYQYEDVKQGKSTNGRKRGVCPCASGKPCKLNIRQNNTLIPWCLVHTANRYNNWAGLYGRLDAQGFFSTTVTIPEPMAKQGRVLHPYEDRVVSVRECARAQGFSDSYRFSGNINDKYRQIGNAVPPPLAEAIGREIIKALNNYV